MITIIVRRNWILGIALAVCAAGLITRRLLDWTDVDWAIDRQSDYATAGVHAGEVDQR